MKDDGRLAALVFWSLMAVIAVVPLPLASNRPWAWSLLSFVVGALLVLWAVAALRRGRMVRLAWKHHGFASLTFAIVMVWFLLQAVPLSPEQWHDPLWRDAAMALGKELDGAISLDPASSITGVMRLICYGGVFWLTAQYGRDSDCARRILAVIATAGAAYGVYGLTVYFTGNETILWYVKWAYAGDLTSSFVNRNSYATYAGLGLLASLGLIVVFAGPSTALGLGNRAGIRHFFDTLPAISYALVAAGTVLATTIVLSHSRGGLISTGIGVMALLAGLATSRRTRTSYVLGAGAVLLIAGVVLLETSGEATLRRLLEGVGNATGREAIHALSWRALSDAPLTGRGLNTFPQLFYLYRDLSIPWESPPFNKAHGVYHELALGAGLVAFGALMLVMGGVTAILVRGAATRRRDVIYPCVGLGAAALVGIHSILDFSVQMPAVAVTFSAMMGVAYAQSWRSDGGAGRGGRK